MRLKERDRGRNYSLFKERFVRFVRYLAGKRTRMFLIVLISLLMFFIGSFFGLIMGGFFGTLDQPSSGIVEFAENIGVPPTFDEILKANIKIPFNYIKGQFTNPEKIFIDINFQNYQKLLFKREQFINQDFFFSTGDDFVPATIRHGDKTVRVDLRLKGDAPEHLRGDKWSLRIKVKGDDTLFGMKAISIQAPRTRRYLNEFIFHEALKREDVMSLRYDFIEVIINGENRGVYVLEEHFDDELIENNNRKAGVLLKFDEEDWFMNLAQREGKDFLEEGLDREILEEIEFGEGFIEINKENALAYLYNWDKGFFEANIDTFRKSTVLSDSVKSAEFERAKNLLESFREGRLQTHEVFDVDVLARYFAIVSVLGAEHSADWGNIRLYYNPITSKIEPIGFDGQAGTENSEILIKYIPRCLEFIKGECGEKKNYYELLFSDPIFFEKYVEELERVSEKEYLDNLFEEIDKNLDEKIKIIYKDEPYYQFSNEIYYSNQEFIRELLDPFKRSLIASYEGVVGDKVVLSVGNTAYLPSEILNLRYNESIFRLNGGEILQPRAFSGPVDFSRISFDIPSGFVWEEGLASDLIIEYKLFGVSKERGENVLPFAGFDKDFIEEDFILEGELIDREFISIDEKGKKIVIEKGNWVLNESLTIQQGYEFVVEGGTKIDLINDAMILSYSDLRFDGGKDKIEIFSSDGTGQGVSVLNSDGESRLENVIFNGLNGVSKNNWELTGAINFYKSDVIIENVDFLDGKGEDGLNIVDSEFEIRNSRFDESFSDCLDIDFGKGFIEDSVFESCGNDGVDFSGSVVEIKNIKIKNFGDKGISVGEESEINAEELEINGGYICIASKDKSDLSIKGIDIEDCDYSFAVYQKKSEFGSSSVSVIDLRSELGEYIVEKGSSFLADERIMLGDKEDVFKELYPEES
tara:strand:- start:1011 stop:3782 length:2772 start_codon:yes stop_codon:yes gene_type:complete